MTTTTFIRHGHHPDAGTTWCGRSVYETNCTYGDSVYWAIHYHKTYTQPGMIFKPCADCENTPDSVMALLGHFA